MLLHPLSSSQNNVTNWTLCHSLTKTMSWTGVPSTPPSVLLCDAGVRVEHTLHPDTQAAVFSHCGSVWAAVSVTMGAVPRADMAHCQLYGFAPWSSWQSYSPLFAHHSVAANSVWTAVPCPRWCAMPKLPILFSALLVTTGVQRLL